MLERSRYDSSEEFQLSLKKVERMMLGDGLVYPISQDQLLDIFHYYQSTKNPDEVFRFLDVALQVHPDSPTFLNSKVLLLRELNRFEEAKAVNDAALEIHGDNEDFLQNKFYLFEDLGETSECIEYFKHASKTLPESPYVQFLLGLSLGKYQEFDKALEALLTAIEIYDRSFRGMEHLDEYYPATFELFYDSGHLLIELLVDYAIQGARIQKCIDKLEAMVDEEPYRVDRWLRLGYFHKLVGNLSEAIECCEYGNAAYSAQNDEEGAEVVYTLADCYMEEGRYDRALEIYGELWEKGEKSTDIAYYNGYCLEKMGRYDQAITFYRKSLDSEYPMPESYLGMGNCLMKKERWLESIHFLKMAVTKNVDENKFEAYVSLAEAEYHMGNYMSSDEAFREASMLGGDQPSLWLNWSYIFYEQGELSQALQLILEGLEELPDNAEMMYRACAYSLAAGKLVQATEFLQFALVLDYDKHTVLFDFFQEVTMQQTLARLINKFKD